MQKKNREKNDVFWYIVTINVTAYLERWEREEIDGMICSSAVDKTAWLTCKNVKHDDSFCGKEWRREGCNCRASRCQCLLVLLGDGFRACSES